MPKEELHVFEGDRLLEQIGRHRNAEAVLRKMRRQFGGGEAAFHESADVDADEQSRGQSTALAGRTAEQGRGRRGIVIGSPRRKRRCRVPSHARSAVTTGNPRT